MTTDLRDKNIFSKIESAIVRVISGNAGMRTPADPTDPDIVLSAARDELSSLYRRLSEVQQQIAERDAGLAYISLELNSAMVNQANPRPVIHVPHLLANIPAYAKHNAAIIRAAEYLEYTLSHMNQISPEDQADAHYDAEQGLLLAVRAKGEKE